MPPSSPSTDCERWVVAYDKYGGSVVGRREAGKREENAGRACVI